MLKTNQFEDLLSQNWNIWLFLAVFLTVIWLKIISRRVATLRLSIRYSLSPPQFWRNSRHNLKDRRWITNTLSLITLTHTHTRHWLTGPKTWQKWSQWWRDMLHQILSWAWTFVKSEVKQLIKIWVFEDILYFQLNFIGKIWRKTKKLNTCTWAM